MITSLETIVLAEALRDRASDIHIDPHPVGERRRLDVAGEEVDLRITLAPCISGPKMAIRILDPRRVRRDLPR